MNNQQIIDDLVAERNDLLTNHYWQTIPIPLKLKLLKIIGAVVALAERGRDLEQWNHQAWSSNAGLQARLKDPNG